MAPRLHFPPPAMLKTTSLIYVVLLVAAFVTGLLGTLAASRALLQAAGRSPVGGFERPVRAPAPAAPAKVSLPTIDC